MNSLHFLFISIIFTLAFSSNSSDQHAKDFITGMIRSGLSNQNWVDDLFISRINSSNFDSESIIRSNENLFRNSSNTKLCLESISEIAFAFEKLLDSLFPVIAFSVDFNILERFIPQNYTNIFNIFNRTLCIYINPDRILKSLLESNEVGIISYEASHQNYGSAGYIFEDLTKKLSNQFSDIRLQIDVDLSNASNIIEDIYHAQQLLVGLLEASTGVLLTEAFITKINNENFNADKICNAFGQLAKKFF